MRSVLFHFNPKVIIQCMGGST